MRLRFLDLWLNSGLAFAAFRNFIESLVHSLQHVLFISSCIMFTGYLSSALATSRLSYIAALSHSKVILDILYGSFH
jgi:hypothetical protein